MTDIWMARHIRPGFRLAGVGTVESTYTHTNGQVTFNGPEGHRTFALDALVEATAPADDTN